MRGSDAAGWADAAARAPCAVADPPYRSDAGGGGAAEGGPETVGSAPGLPVRAAFDAVGMEAGEPAGDALGMEAGEPAGRALGAAETGVRAPVGGAPAWAWALADTSAFPELQADCGAVDGPAVAALEPLSAIADEPAAAVSGAGRAMAGEAFNAVEAVVVAALDGRTTAAGDPVEAAPQAA